jgi:transcriptional regulator with XRE-family HTH domain
MAGGKWSNGSMLKNIGEKIRETRKAKNLTLQDVAKMSGLTTSLLSQIENSKANPSITTLLSIARILNTPLGTLFDISDQSDNPVIRKNERPVARTSNGIVYYLLTPRIEEKSIEVLYSEFEPGANTGEMITHHGIECGIVIEGKLEVQLEDTLYILNAGDTINLDSSRPHKIMNAAEKKSTAIWINSPPSF